MTSYHPQVTRRVTAIQLCTIKQLFLRDPTHLKLRYKPRSKTQQLLSVLQPVDSGYNLHSILFCTGSTCTVQAADLTIMLNFNVDFLLERFKKINSVKAK